MPEHLFPAKINCSGEKNEDLLYLAYQARNSPERCARMLRALFVTNVAAARITAEHREKCAPRLKSRVICDIRYWPAEHAIMYACEIIGLRQTIAVYEFKNYGSLDSIAGRFILGTRVYYANLIVDPTKLIHQSKLLLPLTTDKEWQEYAGEYLSAREYLSRPVLLPHIIRESGQHFPIAGSFTAKQASEFQDYALPGNVYHFTKTSWLEFTKNQHFKSCSQPPKIDDGFQVVTLARRKRAFVFRYVEEDVMEYLPTGPESGLVRWTVTCAGCKNPSSLYSLLDLADHYLQRHLRLDLDKDRDRYRSEITKFFNDYRWECENELLLRL